MNSTLFKYALAGTTALAGIALSMPAIATTITINSATTTTQKPGAGDNLTVTGSGSISVTGAGAVAVINGVAAGTVTNAGTLSSDNLAVVIATASDITGGIINQSGGVIAGGTSNSNDAAIWMNTSNISGGIDNSSTITGRSGIRILNSTVTGKITNRATGVISAATSQGILLQGSNLSGGIDNSGSIAGGNSLDSAGILLDSNGTISGTFINRAGADITARHWGIEISRGDISSGVTNLGKIHATDYGIAVRGSGSDISGGINNGGTISGAYAIYVQSGAKISGGILNSGTIKGLSGTAIYLSGLTALTPITIDGGNIVGNIIDDNPGAGFSPVTIDGDFTTKGNFNVSSIDVTSGHTLTVGSGNTITEKNLVFDVGSTSSFGKLVVSNGAINLTGVTVKINADPGVTLAVGDEIMIGDGSSNIAGGPGGTKTAVVDNTSLFDFQIADGTAASSPTDATDLFLFVVANGTNPPPAPAPAPSPGNPFLKAYDVLVSLDGAGIATLQTAIDAIKSSTTIKQVNGIVSSVSPTVDGAAWQAARDVSDAIFDLTMNHLDHAGDTGSLAGAPETGASAGNSGSGLSDWGSFFGQTADQGARDSIAGYDSNTYGFALGIEARNFLRSNLVGAAISYGHTNANSRNANTTGLGIDSSQITLYGSHEVGDDAYLRGMLGYAYDSNYISRHNVGGAGGPTAHGSFAANQYAAHVEIGRHFARGYTEFTPNLLVNWLHYDSGGYTETGAGGGNLTIRSAGMSLLELGAGIKARRCWKSADGDLFLPEVRAGYRYDVIGDRLQDTSTFTGGGGAFSLQGPKPARNLFNLGIGFTYRTTANWEFRANYDYDYRQNYHAHAGTLRATYSF